MDRVTLATAELQAASKMIEAANMYKDNDEALGLRWMNILYEIGQQPSSNTIMLIPSNFPTAGFSPIGLNALDLNKEKK